MRIINTLLSTTSLLLIFLSQALAAPPGGHLTITQVFVDDQNNPTSLMIIGEGLLFGPQGPAVSLGEFGALTIVGTPTDTLIEASLAGAIAPGDYLLTVSGGNGQSQNDEYDLTIGAVGPQGIPGPQGEQGPRGEQGPEGDQGPQGIQGEQGFQGLTGADGVPGAKGDQGIQGIQGDQGAQGVQGERGIQGLTGADGVAGANGDQGLQGILGDQGPQGIQGEQGLQGLTGADGVAGAKGDQGIQGEQGPAGLPGMNGMDGADGAEGTDGATGAEGPAGPVGADGARGPSGPQGNGLPNGCAEGQVATFGSSGWNCADIAVEQSPTNCAGSQIFDTVVVPPFDGPISPFHCFRPGTLEMLGGGSASITRLVLEGDYVAIDVDVRSSSFSEDSRLFSAGARRITVDDYELMTTMGGNQLPDTTNPPPPVTLTLEGNTDDPAASAAYSFWLNFNSETFPLYLDFTIVLFDQSLLTVVEYEFQRCAPTDYGLRANSSPVTPFTERLSLECGRRSEQFSGPPFLVKHSVVTHSVRRGLGEWINEMASTGDPSRRALNISFAGVTLEHQSSFPVVYRFPRFDVDSNQVATEGVVIQYQTLILR